MLDNPKQVLYVPMSQLHDRRAGEHFSDKIGGAEIKV